MKRLLLALAMALMAAPMAAQAQTVIVVRHAEKALDGGSDPVLSEAGMARAGELATALTDAGVTHVFVTPLQRTALTGTPVAQATAVTPSPVSFDGGTAAHVERLAEQVRALHKDAVVLVVGHSNTVPEIIKALGGQAEAMTDCEYDRLTVVRLEGEAAHVVRGRYGARTEACPAA